jgi:hypothetical protein
LFLANVYQARIEDCVFVNNRDDAIELKNLYDPLENNYLWTEILKSVFIGNSRAVTTDWEGTNNKVRISECNFYNHTGSGVIVIENRVLNLDMNTAVLEKSSFHGNGKMGHECSVILIQLISNFTLSDINISDNNCTGIKLLFSTIKLMNLLNLTKNHGESGGGLTLISSQLVLTNTSKLRIINNIYRADEYGGGIYAKKDRCFFQFEEGYQSSTNTEIFTFSGNSAVRGGDQVFGGVSNCSIEVNKETIHFDRCELNNTFWDLVSIADTTSQSTLVDYEESGRIAFCKNTSSSASDINCSDSYSVSVYRGEIFTVPLMVADDCCYPLVELIEAKVKVKGSGKSPLQFKHDSIQRAKKHCHNHSFVLTGGLGLKTATIEFSITQQYFSGILPVTLTVDLKKCPMGFRAHSESGECGCQDTLKFYKIQCFPGNLSLLIPALTWVGELEDGSGLIAVRDNCQYCKREESHTAIDLNKILCISHRAGVLCGVCVSNYSLLLGGYECDICSNTAHKGVLLLTGFIFAGIALVLMLLGLNLTVSTGMINGHILLQHCLPEW